jgi:hypothetical protein
MVTGDVSKLPKIAILHCFFPIKTDFNWFLNRPEANFSLLHMNIFMAMRGTAAPLQTTQTEGGTSPFWQPPDVTFWWDGAEKVVTFLNNISRTKNGVWGLNRTFFTVWGLKRGGGDKKPSKHVYIRERLNIVETTVKLIEVNLEY